MIQEIIALYDAAASLVSAELYRIIDRLPEQLYEFKHHVVAPYIDRFTGETYRIAICSLSIDNLGVVAVRFEDSFGNDCKCGLYDLDHQTLRCLLYEISEENVRDIPSCDVQEQIADLAERIKSINELIEL